MIDRYTRPEMGHIFSLENKYAIWQEIEVLACEAHAEMGVIGITKEEAAWIREHAAFNKDEVDAIEAVTNHDVIAFLTNMGEYIDRDVPEGQPKPSRWVHFGMTSSDLGDTALCYQLVQATDILIEDCRKLGEICLRHDLFIIADEIHCELVMPGFRYTPFASLDERFRQHSVTCTSPSKAFNLAGLQVANIFAADPDTRGRIVRALEINETGMISPFAIEALMAAYNEGDAWLDALNEYLWGNYVELRDHFAARLPQFLVLPLEGTYLVWIDCRAAGLSSAELDRRLTAEARVRINPGAMYGAAGEGFIRVNIACPRALLREGIKRMTDLLTR